jgi:hypothetical protein
MFAEAHIKFLLQVSQLTNYMLQDASKMRDRYEVLVSQ